MNSHVAAPFRQILNAWAMPCACQQDIHRALKVCEESSIVPESSPVYTDAIERAKDCVECAPSAECDGREDCGDSQCQACCQHDERECGHCSDCGHVSEGGGDIPGPEGS